MKKVASIALALLLSSQAFSQNGADEFLNAKWKNSDGRSCIQFFKMNDGTYGAKIIWLSEPNDKNGNPILDKKNPDKSKRNNPLLGIVFGKDIKFKDGKWYTDNLYSPEHGMVATGVIWMEGKNVLKVKGSKFFITKTESFSRIE